MAPSAWSRLTPLAGAAVPAPDEPWRDRARFGRPEEVAALVAFVASPRIAFLQASIIDLDGGQTRTI